MRDYLGKIPLASTGSKSKSSDQGASSVHWLIDFVARKFCLDPRGAGKYYIIIRISHQGISATLSLASLTDILPLKIFSKILAFLPRTLTWILIKMLYQDYPKRKEFSCLNFKGKKLYLKFALDGRGILWESLTETKFIVDLTTLKKSSFLFYKIDFV